MSARCSGEMFFSVAAKASASFSASPRYAGLRWMIAPAEFRNFDPSTRATAAARFTLIALACSSYIRFVFAAATASDSVPRFVWNPSPTLASSSFICCLSAERSLPFSAALSSSAAYFARISDEATSVARDSFSSMSET